MAREVVYSVALRWQPARPRPPLPCTKATTATTRPYALLGFTVASIISLVLLVVGLRVHDRSLTRIGAIDGVVFGLNGASFLYTTRRGKFVVWGRILQDMNVRGDERVLDLGLRAGCDPDDGRAVPDERECNRRGHLEDRRSIRQLAECVPSEREP